MTKRTRPPPVISWVKRLRREGAGLSRNRNYDTFEATEARQGRRLHMMLQQLERDLLGYIGRNARIRIRGVPGEAEGAAARTVIEVDDPSLRLRRTIFLDPQELELLCHAPELARMLSPARKSALS